MATDALPFERLGAHILRARRELGLSQSDLAERSSLTQAQISYFESGRRQPALDQLLQIAKALDVPIQRLLSGTDRPGESLADIAMELRRLGVEDLWIKGATVPGASRRADEVISLALSAREPDPRIVEAMPAVLAWNEINPTLLRAYGSSMGTVTRTAWLADIALSIDRQGGFPGGCRREPLEHFLESIEASRKPKSTLAWDDLGKPTSGLPASAIWKRWHISYDATLAEFERRARHLNDLRMCGRRRRLLERYESFVGAQRKQREELRKAEPATKLPEMDSATKLTTSKAQRPRKGDGPGRP